MAARLKAVLPASGEPIDQRLEQTAIDWAETSATCAQALASALSAAGKDRLPLYLAASEHVRASLSLVVALQQILTEDSL